jgi:hypothetical protein
LNRKNSTWTEMTWQWRALTCTELIMAVNSFVVPVVPWRVIEAYNLVDFYVYIFYETIFRSY